MNNTLEEIHPGEILMQEFIEPMQLDRVQLAAQSVSPQHIWTTWCKAGPRSRRKSPVSWARFSISIRNSGGT